MGSLILMSMIVATVAAPTIAARDPSPRRGLKRMLLFVAVFDLVWVVLVAFVFTGLVPEYVPP
jgi:heme/copper-type cytochrome/quinol oxidase subunit 3